MENIINEIRRETVLGLMNEKRRHERVVIKKINLIKLSEVWQNVLFVYIFFIHCISVPPISKVNHTPKVFSIIPKGGFFRDFLLFP